MHGPDEKTRLAQAILANRQGRSRILPPALFGEWGWEVLLALFIADAVGRRATGYDVANTLSAPNMVISRWVKYLSSSGLVIGDGDGDLSDPLTLAPATLVVVEQYLDETKTIALTLINQGDLSHQKARGLGRG